MLRVNVEVTMNNGGLRQIGEVLIVNTSKLAEISDYKWTVYIDGFKGQTGSVKGHRRSDGWIPLLSAVLKEMDF